MRKIYSLILLCSIFSEAFAQNDSLARCLQNGFITSISSVDIDNAGNILIGGSYTNDSTLTRAFISKITQEGEIIFNHRVHPNNSLVSLVDKVLETKDGKFLYFGYHFDCDVGPFVYYMEKADSLGQLIWSKQLGDWSIFLKEAGDSSIYILRNSNLLHFSVNGDSIGSIPVPGSLVGGGIALGNKYVIRNHYDSLEVVDSNAVLLNKIKFPQINYQLIAASDSTFYVARDTALLKLNSNLQVLNHASLPGLYDYVQDLQLIDNELWVLKRSSPQLYKFDLNLNQLATVDFSNTMDATIRVDRIMNKDSSNFYALCNESNHILVKCMRKTNYVTHSGYQDASIYSSRCDSTLGNVFSIGSGLFSSHLGARFFVTVKNTGTLPWDSVWVNAYIEQYSMSCAPVSFSKKYIRTVQPGDTAEFFVGWLWKYIPYVQTNQLPLCFYASSPNYLQDYNHFNDTLCSNFTITNIVSVEEDNFHSEILLFPNPAADAVTVNFSMPLAHPVKIAIYDIFGRSVSTNFTDKSSSQIQTSTFENGIYFYSISDNQKLLKCGKLSIIH